MTPDEMRQIAITCEELAVLAASEGDARGVMTRSLMCCGWLMTAETCERQDKIIERLDKLIEQGEARKKP